MGSQWKALRHHSLAIHGHKEGRYSDSPCPWEANEKRFAITHWQFMGIGGTESAAP
jgi:hypothetical protein